MMNERKRQIRNLPTIGADPKNRIKDIRVFALDMDGTIYLGDRWIDGAKDFLHDIIETGREFFFLTNNSSKSPKAYVEKLHRMGFETTLDHIITSGQATIWYLKKHFPGKRVFLLGNDLLRAEFEESGIAVTQSGKSELRAEPAVDEDLSKEDFQKEAKEAFAWDTADLVVTGFDTTLDYVKMCQVCDLVRKGLPYVATHPDYNCPTETGFVPDIGAISAFIKASTGREPDVVVGKPNAPIAEYLLERARGLVSHVSSQHKQQDEFCMTSKNALQKAGQQSEQANGNLLEKKKDELHSIDYNEIAMVGDRLYTDVACGVNAGMTGILVLSGEASMEDVQGSQVKPDLIFDSVKDIKL